MLARRGRVALWFLVGFVAAQGLLSRYLAPEEIYKEISLLVGGDYWSQELVLMQHPWTEGLHRLLGVAMLVAGMLQFNPRLRRERPRVHRWTGRVFLGLALVISVTGLFMGFAVPFSGWAESAFITEVAVLMLWFAAMAWTRARQRNFTRHREWMIRTFGLSFFIAIQRLYYVPLWLATGLPEREVFLVTGNLAVVTVLVAAECWINLTRNERLPQPQESPA